MRKTLLTVLLGGLVVAAGSMTASAQTKPAVQAKPYAPEGPTTCLTCHDDQQQAPVLSSVHGVQGDSRTPM